MAQQLNPHKSSTFSDVFVDTYVIEENPRRVFIQLPELIKHPDWIEQSNLKVFQDNVVHNVLFEYEGMIPIAQIRHRYAKSLRQCGDNVPRLFILLNQLLRKEAIELIFPEIALMHHNCMAKKQSNRERHEFLQRIKKIPIADRKLHAEVRQLTQNVTVRKAAKFSMF